MTSNLGARHITERKSLGFRTRGKDKDGLEAGVRCEQNKEYEETKKEVIKELKRELKPEFTKLKGKDENGNST